MRKIALLFVSVFLLLPLTASPSLDLRAGALWSYDTNVFSSPLPTGYNADGDFPNGGEFLKRHNVGVHLGADIFSGNESRFGLSTALALSFPVSSVSIVPEGEGNDWSYVKSDSLEEQHASLFLSIGPVFRYSFGSVEIVFPIRLSVGSYDWFTTGFVFGVAIEPGVNIFVDDDFFITFSAIYDAHMMKFLYSVSEIYDAGYIMLTAGFYAGCGIRIGG